MGRLFQVAVAGLVVGLGAAPARAADPMLRKVIAIPVDGQELRQLGAPSTSLSDAQCVVGNLNPPHFAINNFLFPPEEYQLSFDPLATCTTCPVGFHVEQIHIALQFPSACGITLAANLTEPDPAASPDCPSPGVHLCDSQAYVVNVPAAGLYDVVLPVSCDCAFLAGYRYNLSVYFLNMVCNASLLTDNQPGMCTNWNNYGQGWEDLRATYAGWPGSLAIWADVGCCESPVPLGGATWGSIKSLYDGR